MCVSASRAGCKRRWDARSGRKRACVFLYVRVCVRAAHWEGKKGGQKKKKEERHLSHPSPPPPPTPSVS